MIATIQNFLTKIIYSVLKLFGEETPSKVYDKYVEFRTFCKWNPEWKIPFAFVLILAALILAIIFLVIIILIIRRCRKRKVNFFVDGKLYKSTKTKFKKAIAFPEVPVKDGFAFVCWAKDKVGKVPYTKTVLDKKKSLTLYAIFEVAKKEEEVVPEVQEPAPQPVIPQPTIVQPTPQYVVPPIVVPQYVMPNYMAPQYAAQPVAQPVAPAQPVAQPVAPQPVPVEPVEAPIEYGPAYYYDEIRYAMLGYERSNQFKKLGVQVKQIIAEMFQKDDVVYLYLAVDPSLMAEKGFKVERYEDSQFAIVPCKKAIKSKEDLEEALKLVKEAMTVNNLVKSEVSFMRRPTSDEQTRKSGFVFFIKNDTVATSAADYYRLLRAIVLSYQKKEGFQVPQEHVNRMILKIYKKEELVYVYLHLDPSAEGLVNVSFDKNFVDTPAMLEIKNAEDFLRANELIDKLMYRFGMMRSPAKAEISLDDQIDVNCGFGYRIKN
ncbi:MAG: InlB B-repeat-containing protein [Clostridia bacterium]|nr:InlB B-repeat-containing protein [Clostridia bacterium]